MALTAYSLCPGGTGKKLKFCSPGCLEELEKIYKFMEADQFLACLNYIQSLLEKESDRPCLMALKCQVLERMPERQPELVAAAKQFYAVHPESPVAVAEAVRAQMMEMDDAVRAEAQRRQENGDFDASFVTAQLAQQRKQLIQWGAMMEQAVNMGPLLVQTVEKIPLLVQMQIAGGLIQAAGEWTHFLLMSEQFRAEGQRLLNEIVGDRELPLFVRALLPLRGAPEGRAWSEKFVECVAEIRKFQWSSGEAALRALAAEFPEMEKTPEYWANLALVQEWKCDIPAAIHFWEKFLETADDFDEKLEVQTRIYGISTFPLDDPVNVYRVNYPLTETDAVKDALLTDPCVRLVTQDIPPREDGSVALAAYDILDGEKLHSADELAAEDFSVEDLPMVVGTAILWARQTDKAPRLEVVNVLNPAPITELVTETLGPWLAGEPTETVERQASATFDSFSRDIDFPRDTPQERAMELYEAHYRNLLVNRWVNFPLGVLDRMSILKAAADPAYRLKVEAVVQIIRFSLERNGLAGELLAALREKLGLPELPEIAPKNVATVHPMFYDRVDVRKIPTDGIQRFFQRCMMLGIADKAIVAARFIIENVGTLPESLWFQAATFLLRAHDRESDLHKLADEARAFCERQGIKHSMIDLMEMELYMEEGNQSQFMRMLNHLQAEHQDDPEVIRTLLYLQQSARAAAQRMGGMPTGMDDVPGGGQGSSGLWTPGGSTSGGGGGKPGDSAGGASKLWVPD